VIAPRWRKVVRDLLGRPGRSALAVLAMAAGVFEIGAMLYKYALLQPELTTMYGRTRPSSATLTLDRVSDELVDSVRRVPGVGAAEGRPVIVARARVGPDEWVPAILYVIRDFDQQQLDTFEPEAGAWPPADDEVLLERSALTVAKAGTGDRLLLRPAGAEDRSVRVAGTVHAAGMAPAWMEHSVPGFVSWRSPLRGGEGESAQIRIAVADHPLDEGYVREVADSVKAMLERSGHVVSRVTVPVPGRHPHADQMESFLFLLLAFGIVSFVLSAVLVAGMVHAVMAEQVRQVGMMKAIGATDAQVAGLYLGQVAALATAALAVGLPAGLVVGRAYAEFAAGILNADLSHRPFPVWVVVVVAVVGVLVPLLAALGPVRRASRITVREALGEDPAHEHFTARSGGPWLARLAWVPRPLLLSLRTAFQRRGRLALTVGLLAVGGAAFMSALNVASAWTRAVDDDFRRRRFDVAVGLAEPQAIEELDRILAGVPGVERAEYWAGAAPYLIGPGGVPTVTVTLFGLDPGSRLLDLPLVAGRWLRAGDRRGVVVNRGVLARHPGLGVGDTLRLRAGGRTVGYPIVGVVKELVPMPVVYAPREAVLEVTAQPEDLTRSMRIVTAQHDEAAQRAAAGELEREFERRGIEVRGLQRMSELRQGIVDHLVIIFSILTAAALVVVVVGSLGLATTLTLDVVHRTREIGVLGAIGATPAIIARHVWMEAVLIGLASWVAALLLAAPISYALEVACGSIFLKAPLPFHMSWLAALAWLLLVFVLASLASFLPARRAARLTVREALAHV
jgi:putative ABC transport system permease protein